MLYFISWRRCYKTVFIVNHHLKMGWCSSFASNFCPRDYIRVLKVLDLITKYYAGLILLNKDKHSSLSFQVVTGDKRIKAL